jgi:hypothetical protein
MSVRPRLAVLAVLAAGGTAFGGYYLWPTGRHISACHAPVPAAAQKAYAGRIRYDVSRAGANLSESWYDPMTGRSRNVLLDRRGKPTAEVGALPGGRTVWLSYDGRTWRSEPPLSIRFHPQPNAAAMSAQANRDKVARGRAAIVGHELVRGRETLHLREALRIPPPKPPAGFHLPKGAHLPKIFFRPTRMRVDTWVDALTYLTVRTRTAANGGWSVSDESWLRRTPANVAKTVVRIPQGFKRETPGMGVLRSVSYSVKSTTRCAQS